MSTLPSPGETSPQLRLFLPASPGSGPGPPEGPQCDVLTAFERLVLPELAGRTPQTVGEYRLHLRRLQQFWTELLHQGEVPDCKYRINDPVLLASPHPTLEALDKALLLAFREWVRTELGRGARTANKHLGSVLAVLRAAEGERWIDRVPRLKPLEHAKAGAKHYLDYEQLSALYEACPSATWPIGLASPPGEYWQALLVLWFNLGPRTQEAVRYESRMTALTWANVSWCALPPAEWFWSGRVPTIANELGWLSYTPQKQRRLKPEPLVLPLNAVLHAHLRAIEPAQGGAGFLAKSVFPFPLSPDAFYATWEELCAAAGLDPAKSQIKHLRKTCETWHNFYRRGIGPYITGHAERTVSALSYDNVERSVQEALLGLPQPEAFCQGLCTRLSDRRVMLARASSQRPAEQQLRLF